MVSAVGIRLFESQPARLGKCQGWSCGYSRPEHFKTAPIHKIWETGLQPMSRFSLSLSRATLTVPVGWSGSVCKFSTAIPQSAITIKDYRIVTTFRGGVNLALPARYQHSEPPDQRSSRCCPARGRCAALGQIDCEILRNCASQYGALGQDTFAALSADYRSYPEGKHVAGDKRPGFLSGNQFVCQRQDNALNTRRVAASSSWKGSATASHQYGVKLKTGESKPLNRVFRKFHKGYSLMEFFIR